MLDRTTEALRGARAVFDHDQPAGYNETFARGQIGPVAQLGARVNGIHEVTGSNPVWSTSSPRAVSSVRAGCEFRLGWVSSLRRVSRQNHTLTACWPRR